MTETTYKKAGEMLEKIKDIQRVVNELERISLYDPEKHTGTVLERTKKVLLRFLNYKRSSKEEEKAGVILFDGVSTYGTDVPIDDELLPILRAHFERKLAEAKVEFERLGEADNAQ